jgi:hypothetical protein
MVGLFVALASWALSSPPLSTPDEILHIANIWCAESPDGTQCIDKSYDESGTLIGTFGYSPQSCFWRQPALPASCTDRTAEPRSFFLLQDGSYYHSGFQRAMHQFIGSNGPMSILRMKLFNVVLFGVLSFLVLLIAPIALSKSWLTALAVTATPFSLWLIASINPSGWGITGVPMIWILLTTLILQIRELRGRQEVNRLLIAVTISGLLIAVFMSFQARRDVMLFAFVVILAVILTEVALPVAERLPTRGKRLAISVGGIAVLVLVGLAAQRGVLGFAIRSELKAASPDGPTAAVWFTNWITHFPAVFLDAYGAAGLGENDIRIPQLVMIVSLLILGGVLMFASQRGSLGQLSSGMLLALALAAILWFASIELDLYNVPGRYVMPLFPVIVGMYLYYSRSSTQFFDVLRLRYLAIGLLSIANALGLYSVLERYTAGSTAGLRVIPVRFDEWWWPFLPIGPNGVLIFGSVSWAIFLVYAFRFVDERKAREIQP